jgi:hypothetical protein
MKLHGWSTVTRRARTVIMAQVNSVTLNTNDQVMKGPVGVAYSKFRK